MAEDLRLRKALQGPISSMLGLVESIGALVLWQKLPPAFAGYAFCDAFHGPAIVLNLNGRNANELVRRFTLAHELAHVLFDRADLHHISDFDRYEDFWSYADNYRDPREVRANAFAIHLLLPEAPLRSFWRDRRDIRGLMTTFGISFEATRAHLWNYELLGREEEIAGVTTTATDEWKNAESYELWYPAFDAIPIERRHAVARMAFDLWNAEQITTSRLREALGTSLGNEDLYELAELYGGDKAA